MGKSQTSLTTFRLIFWGLTILPFATLVLQLGPIRFMHWLRDVCTVDRSIALSLVLKSHNGYAIVDNLYVFAGVPYIVSNAASDIIDVHDIVSPGCKSPDHSSACITSSEALKIVSLEEARQIFGRFVHKVPGVTFISTASTLPSSSHLESILANLWRIYSSLQVSPDPSKSLSPRKLLLPSVDPAHTPVNVTSSFISIETKSEWEYWVETPEARRFERGVIAHRTS